MFNFKNTFEKGIYFPSLCFVSLLDIITNKTGHWFDSEWVSELLGNHPTCRYSISKNVVALSI